MAPSPITAILFAFMPADTNTRRDMMETLKG
jgi:hypothetical protein